MQSQRNSTANLLPNEQEVSFEAAFNALNRYKSLIIGFGILVVVGVAGWTYLNVQESKQNEAAQAKMAAAKTTDDFKAIVRDFPGTDAAVFANLNIADAYFKEAKWDSALSAYQDIINHHPESIFLPSAKIGIAAVAEAKGEIDNAIKAYRDVAVNSPKSFQAPQAQFAAARLLESSGKLQEARKGFEDLVLQNPDSSWKAEASARLQKLDQLLKTLPAPKS